MNRTSRLRSRLLFAGALALCGVAHAQNPPAVKADSAPTVDELQALLNAVQPTWTTSTGVHVGGGYRDNLLLSRTNPAHSGFTRAGVEALVWHVPRAKVDYFAFLNADYTRYFTKATDQFGGLVDHEAQAFAGIEWRYRNPGRVNLTLDGQGYFLDQVFDISDPSVTRDIQALKVKGVKVGPTVRLWLWRSLWAEGDIMFDRQKFDDGLNDASIREATGRLGWTPNDRIELSVGGTERRRDFDRRPRISASRILSGLLVVHEREAEGRLELTLGGARHWTTHTRAGVRHYIDNAVGYLNFHDRHAAQELEWSANAWLVHAEVELRRKQYESQFAEGGSNPPPVVKNEFVGVLRVERKLSPRWTIYAEFNDERSRSNDAIASYRSKEGLLGARWSWEK